LRQAGSVWAGPETITQGTEARKMDITKFLKAGQPCLLINTLETERAIQQTKADVEKFRHYSWDLHNGIIDLDQNQAAEETTNPIEALQWLNDQSDCVFFMQNLQHMLNDVEVLQMIQNSVPIWKASACCLIMVGNQVKLPVEIENNFQMIDFNLPTIEDLEQIMKDLVESVEGVEMDQASIEAAQGLTEFEAETAFALSLVEKKKFDPEIIIENKKQMIKRSGLMEFHPPVDISEVGGMHPFKKHLMNRLKAFEPGSKLPRPKAFLLVGKPGTGKSLTAKAAASILNRPLIRLDIGSLKGSLVGQSEQNLRRATSTIDAFGTAVVWMDEIEKGFSGVKSSGHTDGGTSAGMFGTFLTWMQETTSNILIMATANDIDSLPAPFLRAGRFDAIFYVDNPNESDRKEIIDIMNNRYGSEIKPEMAAELDGFTGAEIEQIAKDSIFDGIEDAKNSIVPLSVTMKEEIEALERWAKTHNARLANDVETKTIKRNGRKIQK
jgi:SpoVK/Ycf46/Vps4 family AAA+-type ATPase